MEYIMLLHTQPQNGSVASAKYSIKTMQHKTSYVAIAIANCQIISHTMLII